MENARKPNGRLKTENVNPKRVSIFHPALIGLVAAAVLARIVIALVLPRIIKWDESSYLLLGYNLMRGNGFTTGYYPEVHHPPLYPILSGISFLLFGDFEQASNLLYAIFGGLLLLPVFDIAQRVYGSRTAWLVVILLAIYAPLSIGVLYWGTMIEPLYLFLLYGGFAALLVGLEDHRAGMFSASGVLLGLAYLVRPEAISHFGAFLILGCIWLWRRPLLSNLPNRFALGAFVISFVLVSAPYMWYLHSHTGQWMVTGKVALTFDVVDAMLAHDVAAFDRVNNGLDDSGKEINWWSPDRFKRSRSLWREILADPGRFMHRVYLDFQELRTQLFGKTIFSYWLLPFVVVALFKEPWDWRRLMHEVFLVTIVIVLLLVFLPFAGILVRYFAPVFPVLLMWTAHGALGLGTWVIDTVELLRGKSLSPRYPKAILGWLPAAIVVLFLMMMVPVAAQEGVHGLSLGEKKAGLWLREHSAADAGIMSCDINVGLYANRRYVASPNTDWTSFLQYARSRRADYLVTSSTELTRLRPQMSFLLATGAPELELVFSTDEPQGRTLVYHIYQRSIETTSTAGQTLEDHSIPNTKQSGFRHKEKVL